MPHLETSIQAGKFQDPSLGWLSADLFSLFKAHEESISRLTWAQEQDVIITGSLDGQINMWNGRGESYKKLGCRSILGISALSSANEAPIFVFTSIDAQTTIHGISDDSKQDINSNPFEIWSICFLKNDDKIISGSTDGIVSVWDVKTGTKISSVKISDDALTSVAVSPRGDLVYFGSGKGTIITLDSETLKVLAELNNHNKPIGSISFSPDSKLVLTGSNDKRICLIDVTSTNKVFSMDFHNCWVCDVKFSPTNRSFSSGFGDGTVRIWDLQSTRCLHTFSEHKEYICNISYNKAGTHLVSAGHDGILNIYSVVV